MNTIALVSLGPVPPGWSWDLGPLYPVAAEVDAVASALGSAAHGADAVLLWDPVLGEPPRELVGRLLDQPVDGWHAGLILGQGGRPAILDHVAPRWMLNLDPPTDRQTTSWRLSLRALLVRSRVVQHLGGPCADFDSLAGAGLDLGLRWIMRGAILRHEPALVAVASPSPEPAPTQPDELRLIARSWGRKWALWSAACGQRQGTSDLKTRDAFALIRATREADGHPLPLPYEDRPGSVQPAPTVSVILPTVDRYPYLETVLRQLSTQTAPPDEVIVIDQTAPARRRTDLDSVAPELPVRVITLDRAGQCRSRNTGLLASSGEVVLFIDDDDEIPDDLIETHLARLRPGIDAHSGGVDDATAGPPPTGFRHRRVSDVFPTNNTVVRRSALAHSGLFDPAYDRGSRADHDLGMRLYLSGALAVYDPSVMVFHHHAPRGGLRTHGARKVTRASSRRSIRERHLPAVTEAYLGLRYYSAEQNDEHELVMALSQLFGEGSRLRRAARFVVQLGLLPDTRRRIRRTRREAQELLARRPEIPSLPDTGQASSISRA